MNGKQNTLKFPKRTEFQTEVQNERASFIKDEEQNEVFFLNKKNVIVKQIESYKPKKDTKLTQFFFQTCMRWI